MKFFIYISFFFNKDLSMFLKHLKNIEMISDFKVEDDYNIYLRYNYRINFTIILSNYLRFINKILVKNYFIEKRIFLKKNNIGYFYKTKLLFKRVNRNIKYFSKKYFIKNIFFLYKKTSSYKNIVNYIGDKIYFKCPCFFFKFKKKFFFKKNLDSLNKNNFCFYKFYCLKKTRYEKIFCFLKYIKYLQLRSSIIVILKYVNIYNEVFRYKYLLDLKNTVKNLNFNLNYSNFKNKAKYIVHSTKNIALLKNISNKAIFLKYLNLRTFKYFNNKFLISEKYLKFLLRIHVFIKCLSQSNFYFYKSFVSRKEMFFIDLIRNENKFFFIKENFKIFMKYFFVLDENKFNRSNRLLIIKKLFERIIYSWGLILRK